jgi:hypothetical protein
MRVLPEIYETVLFGGSSDDEKIDNVVVFEHGSCC